MANAELEPSYMSGYAMPPSLIRESPYLTATTARIIEEGGRTNPISPNHASGGPTWPRGRLQSSSKHGWMLGARFSRPGDHSGAISDFWGLGIFLTQREPVVETGQMPSVETRQMSQQQSSVLSQQHTSVLSQQQTSVLSQQKTSVRFQQQVLCVRNMPRPQKNRKWPQNGLQALRIEPRASSRA